MGGKVRRSVAVLSVACMLATGSVTGLPSAAADTTSASFTVDTFTLGSITSPGLANVRTYADASASVDAAVPGSLVLTNPQNSLLVAPPTGSDFAAGETVDVGATPSSERGALRFDNGCFGDQLTGTLTVVAATYAEGALSSFAATFDAHCTTSPTARYAGTVQLDAPLSYAYAAAAWHADDAALSARVSPVGDGDSQTVVVTNNGPDATTAGAPTVSGQHAADYAVTNDSCAGQTLEPAETCTIGLTFTPAAGGARTAVLGLPLSGHPRADGTLFQLFGQGLLPPQAPRDLAQYAAIGGVGLVWFESSSGRPPSYRVYRRDSAEDDWEQVADVPPIDGTFGQPAGSYLDTEPAPGATYQYAVSGANLAGESAQTPAVSATRASSDPSPGPSSAFAAELWGSAFPSYDTRRAGESVTFSAGLLQAGNGTTGGTSSMELPVVPSAGTYDLVDDVTPGPGQVRILSISSGSIGCTTPSGTLTVHEVAFGADLAPLVYAATLDAECGPESPVYGEVRLHSSHPYRAAAVTPLTVTAESPVGTSAPRQDVTVTNRGVAPLTVSQRVVGGLDLVSHQGIP